MNWRGKAAVPGVRGTASEYNQLRNPNAPWLPKAAIQLLPDLVRASDRRLEWGSGRSTAWLSRRVQSVQSVEHDPAWFERVQKQLERLDRGSVRLLSTAPEAQPEASPYVRVVDEFDEGGLDVCLVDGEHQAACALAVIPKLAPGGVLILGDAHVYISDGFSDCAIWIKP